MLAIDTFLESIDYLPPMPRNLMQLIQLLDRTDVDVDEVVNLVQYDPALTAQIMRLCNSAHFGNSTPASDLHEATTRLGFNEVLQMAAALSTATLMQPQQKGYGIEKGELWRHSITAATVAKLLALERDENSSLVFTACILHDLGKIALSNKLEAKYEEVLAESKRSQRPMLAVEASLLGYDHAQVGGRLLERWNFPPELVQAVQFHHDPAAAPDHARLAAYAYLGNTISCFMGYGCGHGALALAGRTEALDLVGVDAEGLSRCMTRAVCVLRDTQALLTLSC